MVGHRYQIGIWPGDGIGPEVTREATRVLERVQELCGFTSDFTPIPFDAERYLATGEHIPPSAPKELSTLDAILFGAVGDPRIESGVLEGGFNRLLRALDCFLNVRPATIYAEHLCPLKGKRAGEVDFVYVRETTEDCLIHPATFLQIGTPDEVATGPIIYTRRRVDQTLRFAFELARKRGRQRKVTMVHQANAMPVHKIWTRAFEEMRGEYPDVEADESYPDGAAMWLIKEPERFDVLVSGCFIGGILTDIGAMIQGGLGTSGSSRINPGRTSLFEPTHGSAPKYAGKNVVCPLGAIVAVQMMLDYLGETEATRKVDLAIRRVLTSGRALSVDARSNISTSQWGDMVLEYLE